MILCSEKGIECIVNNNRWKILHIVNIGTFMATLDVGIINVALPTMAHQFDVSLGSIQWFVTSYLLTLVAFLPFFGRLSTDLTAVKYTPTASYYLASVLC